MDSAWGPGDTLVWHLLDDPAWRPHFSASEEVLPLVEEALATWSRVPGADIEWRVAGVASGEQMLGDGHSTVSVDEDLEPFAQARQRSIRRRGGPWETIECDVVFGKRAVEHLARGGDERLRTLLHEFGHCVGLRHAAATPTIRWDWGWTDSSVWQKDPQMSYGRDIDNELTEDEMIGGSLLRSAPGWERTWGSIAGSVTLGGRPARFVSVEVLRNAGGRARPAVQVFTDEEGRFLAEGLAPGEYVLWINPIFRQSAHSSLLSGGTVAEGRDLLLARRHRVRAGQETDAGALTLLRGRDQR